LTDVTTNPPDFTPQLRVLFRTDEPGQFRLTATLEGILAGKLFTDDRANPTWGVLVDMFGTIYWGGAVDATLLTHIVNEVRQTNGEALIGLWPDDPRIALLPPNPEYEGWVMDCIDRPIGEGLDAYLLIPDGCQIRRIDRDNIERSADRDLTIAGAGSVENALGTITGFYLTRGDDILSEASASAPVHGVVELGTATPEAHRQQGYATIVCAHLIRHCEQSGYQTYWNCNKANLPSVKLARKLGYRSENAYKLWAWFKSGS
jgi:hypothetical protein